MNTYKEHYIPQVYLRGFTSDNKNIWFYDFEKQFSPNAPVPTKSVCYEKNLYEIRNDSGEIIWKNHLEKSLAKLELLFSDYRRTLINKSFEENLKTECFLSKDEKAFWVTYVILQLLRHPESIKATEKACSHFYSSITTKNNIMNISRMMCLPLFEEVKEDSPFMYLVNSLLEGMLNMGFVVAIDQSDSFITSDFPVCVFSTSGKIKEIDRVTFPITSNTCLLLFDNKQSDYCKNTLCFINNSARDEINLVVASTASKKIFSKKQISSRKVKLYEKERAIYKRPILRDITF